MPYSVLYLLLQYGGVADEIEATLPNDIATPLNLTAARRIWQLNRAPNNEIFTFDY